MCLTESFKSRVKVGKERKLHGSKKCVKKSAKRMHCIALFQVHVDLLYSLFFLLFAALFFGIWSRKSFSFFLVQSSGSRSRVAIVLVITNGCKATRRYSVLSPLPAHQNYVGIAQSSVISYFSQLFEGLFLRFSTISLSFSTHC